MLFMIMMGVNDLLNHINLIYFKYLKYIFVYNYNVK